LVIRIKAPSQQRDDIMGKDLGHKAMVVFPGVQPFLLFTPAKRPRKIFFLLALAASLETQPMA